jgi:hypothetical protein
MQMDEQLEEDSLDEILEVVVKDSFDVFLYDG